MTSDEYPYLAHLSVPDRLRIAAYEARARGVPAIHLRAILDTAEELEVFARIGLCVISVGPGKPKLNRAYIQTPGIGRL